MPPCHGGDRGFDSRLVRHVRGPVAQLVEQRTENPCVAGSIPAWAAIPKFCKKVSMKSAFFSFTKFYVRRHTDYQSLFSTNLQIICIYSSFIVDTLFVKSLIVDLKSARLFLKRFGELFEMSIAY